MLGVVRHTGRIAVAPHGVDLVEVVDLPVVQPRSDGRYINAGEILAAEYDAFVAFITSSGQYPIMQVDFNFVVAYSINDIDVRKDELNGVRITKIGTANQSGNEASTKVLELSIARQRHNGVEVYADPAQA